MQRKIEAIQRHFVVGELVVHVCAAVFAVDACVPASGSRLITLSNLLLRLPYGLPSSDRTMEEEELDSVSLVFDDIQMALVLDDIQMTEQRMCYTTSYNKQQHMSSHMLIVAHRSLS